MVRKQISSENNEQRGNGGGAMGENSIAANFMHCTACCTNQKSSAGNRTMSKSKSNYAIIRKTMTAVPSWSMFFLICTSLLVRFSEGLQCYECLSLYCDSGAVCDAIKSTMVEIFIPKRHFIHFDPSDICPENELPGNSTRWGNLSRECERSDSLCLVSPIEVHTVVDGKKNGKMLENEYTLVTHGYLRGCASRRKLHEFPDTINVRVEFIGRNESAKSSSSNSNNVRGDGMTPTHDSDGKNKKPNIFYNITNIGSAAEFDPMKKTYKDGYTISKVYSHVFYIDQGTKNATKCYEDNCNDKVKFRRGGTSGITKLSSNSRNTIYMAMFVVLATSVSFI